MRSKDIRNNRVIRNKIRRKRQLRNRLAMFSILLVTAFSSLFFGFGTKAQENNEEKAYKYYKSITVEAGDTLWHYAKQYGDDRYYGDYHDYIREVKSINSLRNDKITTGAHLILPYYSPL